VLAVDGRERDDHGRAHVPGRRPLRGRAVAGPWEDFRACCDPLTGGRALMRDEKISDFLARLADRVPAPGGGAAAALHAAQAAALLGMVARYPIRPTVPFISAIRDQHHNPRPAMAQLVNATHIIPKNRPWSKLSGSRKTSTPVRFERAWITSGVSYLQRYRRHTGAENSADTSR